MFRQQQNVFGNYDDLEKYKMKHLLLFFLSIFTCHIQGQNYIEYQSTFNRIDEDIKVKNTRIAIERLDSIFNEYEFIYAQHCIKALQICCYTNDSIKADKWLAKCFKQGVPFWVIKTNDLTKKSLLYSTTKKTVQNYDSLYAIYKSSINNHISRLIDSLFTIDQKYTYKVNNGFILFRGTIYGLQWMKNNKRQFTIIQNIIDHYGFPGERLTGLPKWYEDSLKSAKYFIFYGPNIHDSRAYFMLIHYYSNPRKDINDKLLKNIGTGFLPAYQFGALNDFLARWGKRRYGDYQYYNVWHHDPNKENIESINTRRHLIGLNSFEQQLSNELLYRENRKNKKANSEIILE